MGYERTLLLIVLGIFIAVTGFLFLFLSMVLGGQETRSSSFLKFGGIVAIIGTGMIVYGIVNLRGIKNQKSKR